MKEASCSPMVCFTLSVFPVAQPLPLDVACAFGLLGLWDLIQQLAGQWAAGWSICCTFQLESSSLGPIAPYLHINTGLCTHMQLRLALCQAHS